MIESDPLFSATGGPPSMRVAATPAQILLILGGLAITMAQAIEAGDTKRGVEVGREITMLYKRIPKSAAAKCLSASLRQVQLLQLTGQSNN